MTTKQIYKNAPETPGVYIMKDIDGKIIYVGKAVNLRRRVSSYFSRPHLPLRSSEAKGGDTRIEALVQEIRSIDYQTTDSALEALILESKLIKEHEPKYNIKDKDGKSFLYVEITKEKFPRIMLVRGRQAETTNCFGPFTSASSIRKGLDIIRRIFPWSDHAPSQLWKSHFHSKPCFNYQIGLCPGICVGAITRKEYLKNITNIKLFFQGEKKKIIRALEKEMAAMSRDMMFEKAAHIRGQLFALRHIHDTALIEEDQILKHGTERLAPSRIEGYDISNISGTSAVGGMVVFISGKPVKSDYRLFKIKTIQGPNDTGMIAEMIRRRFNNDWLTPDLILIDGGLGQVSAVRATLSEAGLRIPVVGIAKGKDRKGNLFLGVIPSFTSKTILIAVRDEAHRFSRKFHIKTRAKNFLAS